MSQRRRLSQKSCKTRQCGGEALPKRMLAVQKRRDLALLQAHLQYCKDRVYYIKSWRAWKGVYPVLRADPCFEDTVKKQYFVPRQETEVKKFQKAAFKQGWQITTLQDGQTQEYFVDYQDYRRPRLTDGFEAHHVSTHKVQVNALFVKHLKQRGSSQIPVVYLDSPLALTTLTLQAAGFTKEQLYVPNPQEGFLQKTPAFFGQAAQHSDATLYEWMRDQPLSASGYHVGMDYCCTFQGNDTSVRPQVDIQVMLSRKVLALQGGICWMTFSTMFQKKKESIEHIITWCKSQGRRLGYRLSLLESGTYGNMLYFFWITG